ncbi:hypothetical protein A2526_05035 [candidate division WOR-1 bacterium RIFOXYD2_FULL_36_8]|uniref:Ribbon-helix-helix protein CopG domain-containing protein n=1 Tax=candidate division WOR-1 bacterium RIFOXYB2_FULL_36_35 TaxID=1802578 RepID=A0A1F4S4W7_UNCSA|nr:MAG: hypothetical protein A2230_05340 [candidate division WOR-1 bacterium RIFOXYA2_FULL_36_21]OGC14505.1 MAG: hypothetical protein A2282_09400 [candidate division WOR-1 bacterium RIFOXYA12_FULL_36_13]OGC15484.1 MAG: hypothetical protein A2290_03735 [candidate division WOR-1 bacterium RIFOXYB2_FULL_36_35]OGC38285.1 MAG: hypothetical protein A2526_05035 [candidate division WOR-1 bacterium RIFOXYD2_FULL_36_8]
MANRRILTLSLPYETLKEVNEIAKEEKLSKSELFRQAVADFIGKIKWERASRYGRKIVMQNKISEKDIEKIVHDFRKK